MKSKAIKYVKIGKFKLPINPEPNKYLPTEQNIIGSKAILNTLAYSVQANKPALMIGETGVGKTAMIRYLAYQTKNGFRRLNLNGQTTVDEFVGKMLLDKNGTYWQDGVLIDAMRNGYWLLLDEINAALPEILFILHSLLDDDGYVVLSENNGEIVKPHPNFRIFATMNPSGKYAGTKDLNKALMSRFPIILQLDFPTPNDEEKIVSSYSDLEAEVARNLVKMANDLRVSYAKDEIDFICSTRDLINCGIISQTLGLKEALKFCVLNRCNEEDRKAVQTVVSLYFGKMGEVIPIVDYESAFNDTIKNLESVKSYAKDYIVYCKEIVEKISEKQANYLSNSRIREVAKDYKYKYQILTAINNHIEGVTDGCKYDLQEMTKSLDATNKYLEKITDVKEPKVKNSEEPV